MNQLIGLPLPRDGLSRHQCHPHLLAPPKIDRKHMPTLTLARLGERGTASALCVLAVGDEVDIHVRPGA